MRLSDLQVLRCPFCGGPLSVEQNSALEIKGDEMHWGILWCECSAYPVADGIPCLRSGQTTKQVLALLEGGRAQEALANLLGIPLKVQVPLNFRAALPLLCSTLEAEYLLHRFSDPTFLVSDAAVRALSKPPGPCLDICGGAGHLARGLATDREVWVADLEFWKLWLARKTVVPDCKPVCCDASHPLPFARGAFSFVVSSDGLNYIWQKRLFAAEAIRALAPNGVLLLTHLHNALCENPSAGMPLTPAGYRALIETLPARLYKESEASVDFSYNLKDADLESEPALLMLASDDPNVFRSCAQPPARQHGQPIINPLYEVERHGDKMKLRLRFPSRHYEHEFGRARRYLPEELEIAANDLNRPELIENRVVLFVPDNY